MNEEKVVSSSRLPAMPVAPEEVQVSGPDSLWDIEMKPCMDTIPINSQETAQMISVLPKVEPVIFPKREYLRMLADFNHGAGRIPHDFLRFDPAGLETPLRELLHAEDKWTYVEPIEGKEWTDDPNESEEEEKVRTLVSQSGLCGNSAAFIRNRMMELSGTLPQRYAMAVEEMKHTGPTYMQEKKTLPRSPEKVGEIQPKRKGGVITWCRKIPLGDCEAQEVTIGNLHFRAIDFGDTVRLSERSKVALGNIDALERNQCVLIHTAAGTQWAREGGKTVFPHCHECWMRPRNGVRENSPMRRTLWQLLGSERIYMQWR